MARIDITGTGQTLDSGVAPYDLVYLDGSVWKVATASILPDGLFEGNNIVVTNGSATIQGIYEIEVVFKPTYSISYTGTINIISDGSTSPETVDVYGTGINLNFDLISWIPNPLDFSKVLVNSNKTDYLTIYNEFNKQLTINLTAPTGFKMIDPDTGDEVSTLTIVVGEDL